MTEDSAVIEVSRHDRVLQRVTTRVIMLDGQGMHLRPVAIRYSWPAELDLMAWPACGWPNATPTGADGGPPLPAVATSPSTTWPDWPGQAS